MAVSEFMMLHYVDGSDHTELQKNVSSIIYALTFQFKNDKY